MVDPDLYVIGGTVRATAAMAARAGFRVGCFDAYGDLDLVESNPWVRVIDFAERRPRISPEQFRKIVRQVPWLYSGPLENAAEWLDQAAQGTTLWGNPAGVCREVRDSLELFRALRSARSPIEMPETRPISDRPKGLGRWLYKPALGTGGWDVRRARGLTFRHEGLPPGKMDGVWQRKIQGKCYGATIASDGRRAVVLGICESYRGAPGRPFAYAGSAGPIRGRRVRRLMPDLDRLIRLLVERHSLKGLWNVDMVHSVGKGRWYLLEVNPRPSASMEVLELAARFPLMAIHRRIFVGDLDWFAAASACRDRLALAEQPFRKRVAYATRKTVIGPIPANLRCELDDSGWPDPAQACFWADISHPGTVIGKGEPRWTAISRVRDDEIREFRKFRPEVRGFGEHSDDDARRLL